MVARGCYTLQEMPRLHPPATHAVIYDGQCLFCLRCVRLLRALDRRGALRFEDATEGGTREPLAALRVVAPDGTALSGFFACRRIARVLPALWPLLPLLHAPGAGLAGPPLYDLVARNRSRLGCRV
jgi:predicted DCC family thiol-disulfide oxidoreductase YuxK